VSIIALNRQIDKHFSIFVDVVALGSGRATNATLFVSGVCMYVYVCKCVFYVLSIFIMNKIFMPGFFGPFEAIAIHN
jgi:hypothetical protein